VEQPQASSTRLVATLAAAGLLSGAVLVGIYLLTAPRIERNRAEALNAAILQVLPGARRVAGFDLEGGALAPRDASAGTPKEGEEVVFAGYDANDRLVGYAVPAEGPGFMDTIRLLWGFEPRRRVVVGMQVLESRETPGLGDRIVGDADFHANFDALAIDPAIVPVKHGKKTQPNEVDCITGATISSEAVVSILERSSREWSDVLEPAQDDQEAADADPTRH